jgi:hypothetical protein
MSKAIATTTTAAPITTSALPSTSRRRLLAGSGVGAILAGIGLPAVAATPAVAHPDAILIAACNEYLRIEREFSAYYDSLHGVDMEAGDPAFAILDPIPALVEQIVAIRATTADGHLARARCMAFTYLPHHRACQDDPNQAAEGRFHAAMLRDLTQAERGTPA